MKKLLYLIPAALMMFTSCDGFFKLDNMEGPNAQVTGKFIDKTTNEVIPIEATNSNGYLRVYQLEWDTEAAQTWYVKNNGTYTNNLVFDGKYRVDFSYLPVYPDAEEITLKKGANEINFTKTPFARVKNFTVKYENGIFVANADVEPGDAAKTPKVSEVQFLVYTDKYVHSLDSRSKNYAGATAKNVNPGHVTLTIDPSANDGNLKEEFKYPTRVHFFRVTARCDGNGVNTNGVRNVSKNVIKATPVLSGNTVTGYKFEEITEF